MIETILVRPHARARHLNAPLLKERDDYLSHLFRQGHNLKGLRFKASLLLHAIRLMEISAPRRVELEEIERAAASWSNDTEFHKAKKAGLRTAYKLQVLALDFLRFHRMTIEPDAIPQPFALLQSDYTQYLRETKGLVSGTIRTYTERASKFLTWIALRHDSLTEVTLVDIDDYLDKKRADGMRPGTIKSVCQALRAFFSYVQSQGGCVQNIVGGIRGPAIPKYHEVPQGPSWRDVRRLLKFPANLSLGEIRAKAILLLCSIYGMRSCEIAGLRLEDFDWHNETLTVRRGKRGRVQQFPIQYEVGEAILEYLRSVRPRCSCRHLFVTRYYPHRPVLPTTLRPIVTKRMMKLGIKSEQMGPHSLRHACATQLLRKGSSLREIADFLGHRNLGSVSIYAKHDPYTLRRVADFSLRGVK